VSTSPVSPSAALNAHWPRYEFTHFRCRADHPGVRRWTKRFLVLYGWFMAAEAEKEVSGLELLRQPATLALAGYLNDLHSVLGFEAYLWRTIVKADYSHGDPTKLPKPGDLPPPESAVAKMDIHSAVLGEMVFCRGVNSFLTYLADLMTLIYEKYPKKLPSNKQTTYRSASSTIWRAI